MQRLESLSSPALQAFATACLERVLPAFERRTDGTWSVPHNAVMLAWATLGGAPVVRHRWHRMRAFHERVMVSIDDHGPDFATQNAVAAAGKLLSEMFGFASSGDPERDRVERAKRARSIAYNARDAIDAMQRESLRLDPELRFAADAEAEAAWQSAALDQLTQAGDDLKASPELFQAIDLEPAYPWFAWDRQAPAQGPDLTEFMAAFTRDPKVVYTIYEARNQLRPHGAQATGAEVAVVREMVRVEQVARFSYHLRKPELAPWIDWIVYHVLTAEFLRHELDDCAQIRFRDLDSDHRTLIRYPPHSLAQDDL